jgi:foldase protein PrsA
MQKMIRYALMFAFTVAAGVGLAACGGGLSGDAVAQVGADSISKATLEHWTSVEFVTDRESNAQQPVPAGVVPDPPRYTACIAHLRPSAQAATKSQPQSSTARLRRECERSYQTVQQHVLNVLIVFDWQIEEAAHQHLKLTDAEVKQQYKRFIHERFPNQGELQRYLTNTGESLSDELLRMKIDLIGTKLTDKALAKLGGINTPQQQQAFASSTTEYIKRWVAKTTCRPGYIVSNCKQYKGPLAPDPRI